MAKVQRIQRQVQESICFESIWQAAGSGIVNVHHDLSTFHVMLTGRDGHSQSLMLTLSLPGRFKRIIAISSSMISSQVCLSILYSALKLSSSLQGSYFEISQCCIVYCYPYQTVQPVQWKVESSSSYNTENDDVEHLTQGISTSVVEKKMLYFSCMCV